MQINCLFHSFTTAIASEMMKNISIYEKYCKITNCSRISNRSYPKTFENLRLKPQGNFWELSRTKIVLVQNIFRFKTDILKWQRPGVYKSRWPLATLITLTGYTLCQPRYCLTLCRHGALYSLSICDDRADICATVIAMLSLYHYITDYARVHGQNLALSHRHHGVMRDRDQRFATVWLTCITRG